MALDSYSVLTDIGGVLALLLIVVLLLIAIYSRRWIRA